MAWATLHFSHLADALIQRDLGALLMGTSRDFSPRRFSDSNQRPFGYWPNSIASLPVTPTWENRPTGFKKYTKLITFFMIHKSGFPPILFSNIINGVTITN